MKFLIVFVALFAFALARPGNDVHIVHLDSDVQPESYNFLAETSDGTQRKEEGVLKDVGSDHETLVVHGSFSWKDEKTGEVYTVNYVADENGFQPTGAHIPKVE